MDVDDVLAHAGIVQHAYDPVARRQRYLKTRRLKGRQPGQHPQPAPKMGVGSRVVEGGNPRSSFHAAPNKTAARQAASVARQVAAIQGRLDSLKSHLNELLAKKKAEASSSSSSNSKEKSSTDTSTAKNAGPAPPKTAAQKAAAKKALAKAQDARAKEQKATPDAKEPKTSLSLDEQISKTREVISDVEAKLKSVKEQART